MDEAIASGIAYKIPTQAEIQAIQDASDRLDDVLGIAIGWTQDDDPYECRDILLEASVSRNGRVRSRIGN